MFIHFFEKVKRLRDSSPEHFPAKTKMETFRIIREAKVIEIK